MLDWLAAILELSGAWCIGNKRKLGFFLNILGCLIWGVVAYKSNVWGLLFIASMGVCVNIRNIFRWIKDKEKNRT